MLPFLFGALGLAVGEVEAPNIIAHLESQRIELSEYFKELEVIEEKLNNWKP